MADAWVGDLLLVVVAQRFAVVDEENCVALGALRLLAAYSEICFGDGIRNRFVGGVGLWRVANRRSVCIAEDEFRTTIFWLYLPNGSKVPTRIIQSNTMRTTT